MIKDKNLRLYETFAHEVAMEASASAKRDLTDEQRELSRSLLARTHERIAQMERAQRKQNTKRVRDDVLASARPSLLERLAAIFALQPRAVLAFRDLNQMSDDDLRNALEDALQMIERMS